MPDGITCRFCNRGPPENDRVRSLALGHLKDLTELFSGSTFEAIACANCGRVAGVEPDLFAVCLISHEVIHLDRGAGATTLAVVRAQLAPLVAQLRQGEFRLATVSTYVEFKLAVTARVMLAQLKFGGFDKLEVATFPTTWRRYQGEIYTALMAVASGKVPGVVGLITNAKTGERLGDQEVFELLSRHSASVIHVFAYSLMAFRRAGVSLEEALTRLVDRSTFITAAEPALKEVLESVRRTFSHEEPRNGVLWYLFEALEASIRRALQDANEHEEDWAGRFLDFHCALERGDLRRDHDAHLELSSGRVKSTIGLPSAWNAIAQRLASILSKASPEISGETDVRLRQLESASERLGYPGLYADVCIDGIARRTENRTPRELADEILKICAQHNFYFSLTYLLEVWVKGGDEWRSDPQALDSFVGYLLGRLKFKLCARAEVLVWFGEKMRLLETPALALARLGSKARAWEADLPAGTRRRLLTERSNVLRLARKTSEALQVAMEALTLAREALDPGKVSEASDLGVAWLNVGILQRESGQIPAAITSLETAVQVSPVQSRLLPLESLGHTLGNAGRWPQALVCFGHAKEILRSPADERYRIILLAECNALFNIGESVAAERILASFADLDSVPARAFPLYVALMANMAGSRGPLDLTADAVGSVVDRAKLYAQQNIEAGNYIKASAAYQSAAALAQAYQHAEADALWLADANLSCYMSDKLPGPTTAIALARMAASQSRRALLGALIKLGRSMARQFGSVELDPQSVSAAIGLRRGFHQLAEVVFNERHTPRVLQFVASLSRNAHARSVEMMKTGDAADKRLKQLFAAPLQACKEVKAGLPEFAVIEWISLDDRVVGLLTRVRANGPQINELSADGLPLFEMSAAIGARNFHWRGRRQGEPFEVDGWTAVCDWLRRIVGRVLAPGGHVVLIDHPDLSAIPFHIALGPAWTMSYATDWIAVCKAAWASRKRMHALAGGGAQHRPVPSLGVVSCPRSNETAGALEAFAASMTRSKALAKEEGIGLLTAVGPEADTKALLRILNSCGVAKILCHGQVSEADSGVNLLVAHAGELPPGYTFAARAPASRDHQLDWGTLMSSATGNSRVVFLGACSAGLVQMRGLDERLNLFSALSVGGTASMVAARVKIDIAIVLPIFDEAIEAYVEGMPLAVAVQRATQGAVARGVPRWQANSMTVEGAWI